MRGRLAFCSGCGMYFGTPDSLKKYVDQIDHDRKVKFVVICPCEASKKMIIAERSTNFTKKNVFWMTIRNCQQFEETGDIKRVFRGVTLLPCKEDDEDLYIVDYSQSDLRKIELFFKPLKK